MNTVLKNTFLILIFTAGFLVAMPSKAHAYIDPGSGSYFFQILIAGLVGGLFALKTQWLKITSWFSRFGKRESKTRK